MAIIKYHEIHVQRARSIVKGQADTWFGFPIGNRFIACLKYREKYHTGEPILFTIREYERLIFHMDYISNYREQLRTANDARQEEDFGLQYLWQYSNHYRPVGRFFASLNIDGYDVVFNLGPHIQIVRLDGEVQFPLY